MEKLKSVQQKIPCIFEICVIKESSDKRAHQPYKVAAGEQLHSKVKDLIQLDDMVVSEKLDGTCVLIDKYEGRPWLWARLDRKPNKNTEKRFRKFQNQVRTEENVADDQPKFKWDISKDFNSVPECWIPASGVEIQNGHAMPDSIGHTPGWVPVDINSRQHCWHLTSVDLSVGVALILRKNEDNEELLIDCVKLETLIGHTAELIGTLVNGNPYGLGSKQHPVHLLVIHGSLPVYQPPSLNRAKMVDWFEESTDGRLEGIVWHFPSGELFKLHRHHLGLQWPVSDAKLSKRSVSVSNIFSIYSFSGERETLFHLFSKIHGLHCEMLKTIHEHLYKNS